MQIWTGLLFFAAVSTFASLPPPSLKFNQALISERQRQIWKIPARASEFSEVPHARARSHCSQVEPPQPLTTPDPVLVPAGAGQKVKVSFIVGADGRVHSPLILESAGASDDRNVLRAVRSWRYRPATCNGIPTEAEGKIQFSLR